MSESEPDVVTVVHEKATSLEQQVANLSEFQQYISECEERVQEMDASERSAFYEKAAVIRSEADEAETVEQLLALEEDVEAAIRAPLEQVAVQSLKQFLEVLDPNLSDSTREETLEKLGNQLPGDLETAADVYQSLVPRVNELPVLPRDLIAATIEGSPSQLLNPSSVKMQVETVEESYETLERLDEVFDEAGTWVPNLGFATTERFYRDDTHSISPNRIESKINSIQQKLDDLESAGIPASDVVEDAAIEKLRDARLSEITSALSDIESQLRNIENSYADVTKVIDSLDSFGTREGIFEQEIDELLAQHSQLEIHSFASLEELSEAINDLDNDIESLVEDIQGRLKAQSKMIDVLDGEDLEAPPEVNLDPGGSGPVLTIHVRENPAKALKDCKARHEWIVERLETDTESVDREELLNLWARLSEGEEVKLSRDNEDAIVALSERLSLSVVLSSE